MPEDVFYYRNFPSQSAPEALKDIIKRFRDLVWIPKRSEKLGNEVIDQSWDENCNMVSVQLESMILQWVDRRRY